MPQILVISGGDGSLYTIDAQLSAAGHEVIRAATPYEALALLTTQRFDLIITTASSISMDDIRAFCLSRSSIPVVLLPQRRGAAEAVSPVGTPDTLDTLDSLSSEYYARQGTTTVRHALGEVTGWHTQPGGSSREPEAHAAARWAHAVVPIVDSPSDLRTVQKWSRWIGASSGAVRNWCRTVGISTRRSLLFGRLLRAVVLSDRGRHKPENLLDVVDRRTLNGLLTFAGLQNGHSLPQDGEEFIDRQRLISDSAALAQIRSALRERRCCSGQRSE